MEGMVPDMALGRCTLEGSVAIAVGWKDQRRMVDKSERDGETSVISPAAR